MTFTILHHHLRDFITGHLVMEESVVATSLGKKKKKQQLILHQSRWQLLDSVCHKQQAVCSHLAA